MVSRRRFKRRRLTHSLLPKNYQLRMSILLKQLIHVIRTYPLDLGKQQSF
jgi:hypothetical protein